MSARIDTPIAAYRSPNLIWILMATTLAVSLLEFRAGIARMVDTWFLREEYSHGVLIPVIAAFLIWQRKNDLQRMPFTGSWAGVVVLLIGIGVKLIGDIGTFYILQQYAFVIVLYGSVLALTGALVFRRIAVPLLFLLFMIPLPEYVLADFSEKLQLLSSQVGVWFIRLFGISVFVEGNVIDLGSYQLQVAEACSGLRYLFPLLTLGFIMAYFYKTALWKRALVFLSSIPVSVLMNSLRIGIIGVTVDRWGISMAEGMLHEVQGWAIFMCSALFLMGEIVLLSRVGSDRRPWREIFGLELPGPSPVTRDSAVRKIPNPCIVAVVLLAVVAVASALQPERSDRVPERESFSAFPQQLGEWSGRRTALEQIYLDVLRLDDYIMATYTRPDGNAINLYSTWYASQRAGESAHSPRTCLPGGGWHINTLEQVTLPGVQVGNVPLRVNRALISMGDQNQLVYYWFQQRGRVIDNEYVAKWYIFWDALTRRRTDGAMVRLTTQFGPGMVAMADQRLTEFARLTAAQIRRQVPD